MMNRARRATHVSHERWLVSYADFVTLLFAFFVVLYASAQVDRHRALQLSDAIRSGFQQMAVFQPSDRAEVLARRAMPVLAGETDGVDLSRLHTADNGATAESRKPDFAAIQSELQDALAAEIARKEVALHMGPDGLVVTLREIGFFDSGSATMRPGAEKSFARVAAILREHACALRIEGHTDNVPIHTAQFASNWELSSARAIGLVRTLAEDYGISPAMLSAAGYAEFHPASPNDTNQGRALNRRVDLVIVNSQAASSSPSASPPTRKPKADDPNLTLPLQKLGALPQRASPQKHVQPQS